VVYKFFGKNLFKGVLLGLDNEKEHDIGDYFVGIFC
jgi:hypothetical protein